LSDTSINPSMNFQVSSLDPGSHQRSLNIMNTLQTTHRSLAWPQGVATLVATMVALAFASPDLQAQPPGEGASRTIQSRVQNLTTAPMGEVDGATLADGTIIHWPPHLAARFAAVVANGDRIRVTGRMETGPEGDTHLEVVTLTNLQTNASAENDFGPPVPPRGPERRVGRPLDGRVSGETNTAQGRVRSFTTAPMGETDGLILDDGTVVHWPPHLAARFAADLEKGDLIRVSGAMERGLEGDLRLEADKVVKTRELPSASRERATAAPLPDPRHASADGSDDFAGSPTSLQDIAKTLQSMQSQINELKKEIQKLRDEL
jgi:hypothetical protein